MTFLGDETMSMDTPHLEACLYIRICLALFGWHIGRNILEIDQ